MEKDRKNKNKGKNGREKEKKISRQRKAKQKGRNKSVGKIRMKVRKEGSQRIGKKDTPCLKYCISG